MPAFYRQVSSSTVYHPRTTDSRAATYGGSFFINPDHFFIKTDFLLYPPIDTASFNNLK